MGADIFRTCGFCGCTDISACVHEDGTPCAWIDDDLCSVCDEKMPVVRDKLLAAASSLAAASADCIEFVRHPGAPRSAQFISLDETTSLALDALRMILEATDRTQGVLYHAIANELPPALTEPDELKEGS